MKGQAVELSPFQRVIVLIVGAAFLAVGFGLFIGIIKDVLYGYYRTREEVTVEARLNSVEWRYHSGGRSGGGSMSTEASYNYEVHGQRFTASRVSIFKKTEGFYRPLKRALDEGRPIRVFIDPTNPHFAVIDREFAWFPFVVAVPFSLTFIAGGLLLSWCLVQNFRGKAVPNKPVYVPVRKTSRAERKRAAAARRQEG